MTRTYRVRVAKDSLVFSAGHFITFGENICERLHGHNYRVSGEVSGALGKNQYVIDFILLRDTLQDICNSLDHFMLLPTRHPAIRVVESEEEVTVTFEQRRWVFPRCDCILLPVENTTSELLAQYIGEQLQAALLAKTGSVPERIEIEVDECFGQAAICVLEPA